MESEHNQANSTHQDTNEVLRQIPLVKECLENRVFKTATIIVTLFTFISTLFGNVLIIICILKFKEFHKGVTHKLILLVALADLVMLPVLITYPIEMVKPSLFKIPKVCLIRPIFSFVSACASISFLSFISVDRFIAIMFPLQHMVEVHNRCRLYTSIVIVWIISILTGVIVFKLNMFDKYGYSGLIDGCPVVWYSVEILLWITALLMVVTCIANFLSYSCVIYRLSRRSLVSNLESKRKQMAKTRLFLFVYIVFTVSWLPFLICQLWLLITKDSVTAKCYREYALLFAFPNSALNWIFYGVGNKKYRGAFKKLLCVCREN